MLVLSYYVDILLGPDPDRVEKINSTLLVSTTETTMLDANPETNQTALPSSTDESGFKPDTINIEMPKSLGRVALVRFQGLPGQAGKRAQQAAAALRKDGTLLPCH